MIRSRRDFLTAGSAALICGSSLLRTGNLYAQSLAVPLRPSALLRTRAVAEDYDGTLKEIGALGYHEVEAAGYYNHTAAEVKQAMAAANIKLVSTHHSSDDLHRRLDQIIAFNKEVGVDYIICSSPGFKDPSRPKDPDRNHAFTLDDWRWNADQFNEIGAKVANAGMKFGYHNHTMEFHEVDGTVPYNELIRPKTESLQGHHGNGLRLGRRRRWKPMENI